MVPVPAELIAKHPDLLVRIVGVDPGIRNLFYAYGVDGSSATMSQGEFRAIAKHDSHGQQLGRLVADAIKKGEITKLPELRHRPDLAAILAYYGARHAQADALDALYNCAAQCHWRLTVRARPTPLHSRAHDPPADRGVRPGFVRGSSARPCARARATQLKFRVRAALAECVRRIVRPPRGSTDHRSCLTLVLWGNGNFGTNYRGSAPSHHRQLLLALYECPEAWVLRVAEQGTSKVRAPLCLFVTVRLCWTRLPH